MIPATARPTEPEVIDILCALIGLTKPDVVLETGSYRGETTRELGTVVATYGGRIVSIDTCPECVAATRECCQGLPVTVIHGCSLDWIQTTKEHIQLAFIDCGEHRKAVVDVGKQRCVFGRDTLILVHDAWMDTQYPVAIKINGPNGFWILQGG